MFDFSSIRSQTHLHLHYANNYGIPGTRTFNNNKYKLIPIQHFTQIVKIMVGNCLSAVVKVRGGKEGGWSPTSLLSPLPPLQTCLGCILIRRSLGACIHMKVWLLSRLRSFLLNNMSLVFVCSPSVATKTAGRTTVLRYMQISEHRDVASPFVLYSRGMILIFMNLRAWCHLLSFP